MAKCNPRNLNEAAWYVDHGDGILVPEFPSFEAALDMAARDAVTDPQDCDVLFGSEIGGFTRVATVQPTNHADVPRDVAEEYDIELVLVVVEPALVPAPLVQAARSDMPVVTIEWGRPSGGVRSTSLTYVTIDEMESNPKRSPLTKRGERMYKAVLASIELKADATMKGASSMAARTVVGAARRGVSGLLRKNPDLETNPAAPKLYRAQKVVAKLERDAAPTFVKRGMIITTPDDLVRNTLAEYLGDRAHESFVVLFVNVRNQVIGYTELTSGSSSGVEVDMSGILRAALAANAAAILTVHNHPSGDPEPSAADRALWHRIDEAGALVGIPTLDHLVVGENGRYWSRSEAR